MLFGIIKSLIFADYADCGGGGLEGPCTDALNQTCAHQHPIIQVMAHPYSFRCS